MFRSIRCFVRPPNSLCIFVSVVWLESTGICISADLYSCLYHVVATNTCFTPNFGIYNGVCLPSIVVQISTRYINSPRCKWSADNHNWLLQDQLLSFSTSLLSFDKPPFSFLLFDSFMSRTVFTNLNITYISLNVKLFLFLFYIWPLCCYHILCIMHKIKVPILVLSTIVLLQWKDEVPVINSLL